MQLLHELRALNPEQNDGGASFLGVKELDELLELFLPTAASGPAVNERSRVQIPAEYDVDNNDDLAAAADYEEDNADGEYEMDIPAPVPPPTPALNLKRKQPVVEITSSSSAAGKTQLLYYLTAVAVLPSTYHGRYLGGRDAAVVFIDADNRFDAHRLRDITAGIVRRKMKEPLPLQVQGISADTDDEKEGGRLDASTENDDIDSRDMDNLIYTALQHVHVFRPQSSSSLLVTLQHLDAYLLDVSRHRSATRPLHAIFLDSASAFFWQDRLRDEVARTEEIGRPVTEIDRDREEGRSFHIGVLYRKLVVELRRLQAIFDCAVVYTTWGLSRTRNSSEYGPTSSYSGFRPHLPAPWGTFPSLRLVVQREPIRLFPPGTNLQEAEQDAPLRHEVVTRGKFWAWVDSWGREEWPRRVLEGLERRNRGRFAFWVRDEMVIGEDGDHLV